MRILSGAGLRKTCLSSSQRSERSGWDFIDQVGRDSSQHTMRRQNLQSRRMHVHESHHDFLGILQARILVAKRQRRLVAMMPIGDQSFLSAINA